MKNSDYGRLYEIRKGNNENAPEGFVKEYEK